MKRLFSLFLAFTIMLSLCACDGNWESVNLKEPVELSDNGMVEKDILTQVKNENAIGVFTGKSGDYKYEWTIFGSDIAEPKEMNLGVQLSKTDAGGIQATLNQTEAFGFTALLSISLGEKWTAQSATAYANGQVVASVSVTGSKTSILNINLDGTVGAFEIRPDITPDEGTIPTAPPENAVKDKYNTDPVPEGKPQPVEPEDTEVDKAKTYTCTFSIECSTILNNLDMLVPDKLECVPSNGVILPKTTVTFYEGESVFDVLQRVCKDNGIHLESEWTPIYNSAYVEGIHNLYEFDCGALSGWMYKVNGWYPNSGCSRYQMKDGDVVEWRYTCDLGNDVGGGYAVGG